MHIVVFPEYERYHVAIVIDNWKSVELVFPDYVVGFGQAQTVMR